ncbi:hypothetical protein [Streptomyces omiyaensis]|uniref:Uncharacterized protein n=1 Tax=Streptomyces omiyaensis TaxID=68247 RepID=A0ABW7BUJ1_9ACTN|nr:hypothetical protein [Streptomyces omiyaensis]GGY36878.1 hypothetical protein GCM10010363_16920 [Streptomyces omiyaensis]
MEARTEPGPAGTPPPAPADGRVRTCRPAVLRRPRSGGSGEEPRTDPEAHIVRGED